MAKSLRESNQFSRPDWNFDAVIKSITRIHRPPAVRDSITSDSGLPGYKTVISAQKRNKRETREFEMQTMYEPVYFDYIQYEETFIRQWALGLLGKRRKVKNGK